MTTDDPAFSTPDNDSSSPNTHPTPTQPTPTQPAPLNKRQRRLLGVLIEKARTTPDAYPLSLNGLVTGANQKSNRHPIMNLTAEQVDDELVKMRQAGLVAEVHSGGRVPKYRHFGYDYLGVKGAEAGVMTELLLRGEQTAGDLRTRASRFEPIPDLPTLDAMLQNLIAKGLVIALTPPGRGQLFTHNLYLPEELATLKAEVARRGTEPATPTSSTSSGQTGMAMEELQELRDEIKELRQLVEQLSERVQTLES
jgi:uncharacterized protein YceH (UPF0502 family)